MLLLNPSVNVWVWFWFFHKSSVVGFQQSMVVGVSMVRANDYGCAVEVYKWGWLDNNSIHLLRDFLTLRIIAVDDCIKDTRFLEFSFVLSESAT